MVRPQLTAVNHYDVFPFNHGGSLGIRGLYKALSEWFDINIITFVTQDFLMDEVAISNHVKVIPIVLPDELLKIQFAMYKEYGMGKDTLIDSSPTVISWYHKFPEIVDSVKKIACNSVVVLAEHVFTWRIIKTACPDKHLWYRANNVEYDYKRTTWDKIGCPSNLLKDTYDIEKECCEECEYILTVSQMESDRFMELYKLPEIFRGKFINIQSGYDTDNLKTVLPSQRKKISDKYKDSAFFITSYTPYGQKAVENCIAVAKECFDLQIIIAGTINRVFKDVWIPDNVVFTGVISDEEKEYYLRNCDFALNLLEDGAGINVKMFEYFAFGIPVITTVYGARGIEVTAGKHCIFTENGNYINDIKMFCGMSLQKRDQIAKNAMELLINKYSWRSLGYKIAKVIEDRYDIPIANSALSLKEISLYNFEETESCLPEEPFYIRCAGKYGQKSLDFVRQKGLEPKAFVDDDAEKQKSMINSVSVISVAEFLKERTDEKVIVAVSYGQMLHIAAELVSLKISMEDIFISWDISGRRIMRLSDLSGCKPHYNDAEKWRREIIRRADSRGKTRIEEIFPEDQIENDVFIEDIISEIKEEITVSKKSVAERYLTSLYYKKMMTEFKKQNEIVIVGSGTYGLRLYEMFEIEGICLSVKCFCDNSKERQELKIKGLDVISVDEAVLKYPYAYYIITPKRFENELLRQLVRLGVSVDKIAIYIFMYTGLVD